MVLSIRTNIPAMNAQRHLGQITAKLAKSYQRLASGQRIVTAAGRDGDALVAVNQAVDRAGRSVARALERAQAAEESPAIPVRRGS